MYQYKGKYITNFLGLEFLILWKEVRQCDARYYYATNFPTSERF